MDAKNQTGGDGGGGDCEEGDTGRRRLETSASETGGTGLSCKESPDPFLQGLCSCTFALDVSGDKKQSVQSGRLFLPPLPLWTLSHGVTHGSVF